MLNKVQRKMVSDLANERTSVDTFLKEFGMYEKPLFLSLAVLHAALEEKNASDVECGLAIGFKLGTSPKYEKILWRLFNEDWHHSHEDIISALDRLREPGLTDLFRTATQVVPTYLEFDENRALAVKAIWALGNIGTEQARGILTEISASHSLPLRTTALQQLDRFP